jgi:hypothetical protein
MIRSSSDGSDRGEVPEQRIETAVGDEDIVHLLVQTAQENSVNLAEVATLLEKGATAYQLYQWMEKDVNLADVTLLLGRGCADVTQIVNWVQSLDAYQLASLKARALQNPKVTAENLMQLVAPTLEYNANPKHEDVRPGVGPEPVNGQRGLDNSVTIKSTTNRRIGVDTVTGEIVILDDTNDGTYHGHIRTWDQLTQEMKNALANSGLIDNKGRIILRDEQGNIIGYSKNVIKGKQT